MIYDYRKDLIALINHTDNTESSLIQTLYSLQIISSALLNGQYLKNPEKILPSQLESTEQNKYQPIDELKALKIDRQFKTVGELIQYLRHEHHFTQKDLSDKLGIAISGVSNLEHNHRKCNDKIKTKLCKIFNLTESQFDNYLNNDSKTDEYKDNESLTNETLSSTIKYVKKAEKPEIYISDTYVSNSTLVKVATQNYTLKPNEYVARRNLNNVALLDIHGNQITILSESQIHPETVDSGDIITAVYRYNQYEFQHVLHQDLHLKALQIDELKYGKVEEDEHGNLYIKEDIYGNPIQTYNPDLETFQISNRIANEFNILNGSSVDLAWYHQDPNTIRIRWVHPLNEKNSYNPTTHTSHKNKATTNNTKKTTSKKVTADLDFDLNDQVVNVIIGDDTRKQEIIDLIKLHHGIPKVTDAFIRQDVNQILENALSKADIAIMVQNLNKHNTSKALSLIIKSKDIKFAISNSAGLQSIERAIYRADRGLPAYETSSYNIDYPIQTA